MTTASDLPFDEVTYTVASVARRLGVAPATLRTWDRRYGLGPSAHVAGCHRRYSAADLARLEVMRRLVNQGTPAQAAANAALRMNLDEVDFIQPISPDVALDSTDLQLIDAPSRALARTALSLDGIGCMALINQWLDQYGAARTWSEIVSPVLVSVGERWLSQGKGVEVEHVLSQAVNTTFFQYSARLTRPHNQRPILLAAAADEQHVLPLIATAAVLSEHQIGTSLLGPRVPVSSLSAAVQRIGPSAVFIWSQTDVTGDPFHLANLPQLRPATRYVLGGPGWQPGWPPHFLRINSLAEAVSTLKAAALS